MNYAAKNENIQMQIIHIAAALTNARYNQVHSFRIFWLLFYANEFNKSANFFFCFVAGVMQSDFFHASVSGRIAYGVCCGRAPEGL